jgi:hypothetical protein
MSDSDGSCATRPPTRRLVALGASNLALGLADFVRVAEAIWGAPVEILSALGLGRSYGTSHSLLGRVLPGILDSGLWSALAQRPPAPATGLVTDVGNDIAYGVPVDTILGWIEEVMDRLSAVGAEILVTSLPMRSLSRLGRARFEVFRTIFVPCCRLSLHEVQRRATELHLGLRALGSRRAARFLEPRDEWYGIDPIHVRRRLWLTAWSHVLASAAGAEPPLRPRPLGLLERWRVGLARPQLESLLGFERRRIQPAVRLAGGTTISLY